MNRRKFMGTAAAAAVTVSLPPLLRPASGASDPRDVLRIVRRGIEVNGRSADVFGLIGTSGKPGLSITAGQDFNVSLRNETEDPTIVHWHGLTPPWTQDGVADAHMPAMNGRSERRFKFPVGAAGTHWMHAHTLQEQSLLAAPLIVKDNEPRDEQDVVIMLHDFSFATPEEILTRLKNGTAKQGASGNSIVIWSGTTHGHETVPGTPQIPHDGTNLHLNDIDYDAYLANDRTLDDPEVVQVEPGGRVRLRIINGATATAFTIDLGDIVGNLIAVDGQDVSPVAGFRFPVAMGQRIDIRLHLPGEKRAFPILALREGARERTGIILAQTGAQVRKLASRGEKTGPVVDLVLEQKLRAAKPLASRSANKRFEIALTGKAQSYEWGLETRPNLVARQGDRLEVTMINQSVMSHPMHLHGHHFQVIAVDAHRFSGAMRDTVHIPPRRAVTVALDAQNPGQWAFHCHHLYHMAAGMMTNLSYER
jgi:FtsP/CotA-like multicopper oxidase with cupredoxin domain